ncbi:hypothetical protein LINPERHAP2_LOCUS21532 [Linum perenne]
MANLRIRIAFIFCVLLVASTCVSMCEAASCTRDVDCKNRIKCIDATLRCVDGLCKCIPEEVNDFIAT